MHNSLYQDKKNVRAWLTQDNCSKIALVISLASFVYNMYSGERNAGRSNQQFNLQIEQSSLCEQAKRATVVGVVGTGAACATKAAIGAAVGKTAATGTAAATTKSLAILKAAATNPATAAKLKARPKQGAQQQQLVPLFFPFYP